MRSRLTSLLLMAGACLYAADSPCDSRLITQTNPQNQDRYFQRQPDRCEGVYLENVAGTVGELLVASLTTSALPATWPSNGTLALRWTPFGGGPAHIQAFPLVARKHFQLDVLAGSASSYNWQTILVSRYLSPPETGLVAWTVTAVGGRNQRVYVPVAAGAEQSGPPVLYVVPPVDLTEVYLTVGGINPGDKPFQKRRPLGLGSYPKDQKFRVPLPPLRKGLYRVDLVGDREDQGSVAAPPFLVSVAE